MCLWSQSTCKSQRMTPAALAQKVWNVGGAHIERLIPSIKSATDLRHLVENGNDEQHLASVVSCLAERLQFHRV